MSILLNKTRLKQEQRTPVDPSLPCLIRPFSFGVDHTPTCSQSLLKPQKREFLKPRQIDVFVRPPPFSTTDPLLLVGPSTSQARLSQGAAEQRARARVVDVDDGS